MGQDAFEAFLFTIRATVIFQQPAILLGAQISQ